MKRALLLAVVVSLYSLSVMAKGRFKGLLENRQEMKGVTTYMTPYLSNLGEGIIPYIVETQDGVWFRVKITYEGSSWMFYKEVYLKGAGETMQVQFTKDDKTDKVLSGGYVRERIDIMADENMIEFLDRFRNDPESKVYFVTDGIEEWHKLNAYEKKNFSNVFAAYDVLANEKGKAAPNTSVITKSSSPCFYDMQLGISMADVKNIEKNTLMTSMSNKTKLVYDASIYGNNCFLSYDFEQGKLKSILALFTSSSKSASEICDTLLPPMLEHYGEPSSSTSTTTTWIEDGTKINLLIADGSATIFILPVQ